MNTFKPFPPHPEPSFTPPRPPRSNKIIPGFCSDDLEKPNFTKVEPGPKVTLVLSADGVKPEVKVRKKKRCGRDIT